AFPGSSSLRGSFALFPRTSSTPPAAGKEQAFLHPSVRLPQALKVRHPLAPCRSSFRPPFDPPFCRSLPVSFRQSSPAGLVVADLSDPAFDPAFPCPAFVSPDFVVVAGSSFPVPATFSTPQAFRCPV